MRRTGTVVIGFGNPMRGDDAVGIEVVRRVGALAGSGIRTKEVVADAMSLLFAWENADTAIVLDAMVTGQSPGTVRLFGTKELLAADADPFPCPHGVGLQEAVRLGAALGRLPRRLVVLGIEGHSFGIGEKMSPEIEAAIEPAVKTILRELDAAGASGEEVCRDA